MNYFHDERSKQLTIIVENEQWIKAEVPVDFQNMADLIVAYKVPLGSREGLEEGNGDSNGSSVPETPLGGGAEAEDGDGSGGGGQKTRSTDSLGKSGQYMVVNRRRYHLAGCVLMLTKMLLDYLQCMENIPSLTTDVLHRVLDILKVCIMVYFQHFKFITLFFSVS